MFFVLARQSSRLPLVRRDQRGDDHDPALGHDRYLDHQARVRLARRAPHLIFDGLD